MPQVHVRLLDVNLGSLNTLQVKTIHFHMNSMLHKIVRALCLMSRRVIIARRAESDGRGVPVDASLSAQVEAFRRTEAQHRNSYRELAK